MTATRQLTLALICSLTPHFAHAQLAGHGADFTGVYSANGRENAGLDVPVGGSCASTPDESQVCRTRNYPYNELGARTTIAAVDDGGVDCVPDGLVRLNTRGLYNIRLSHRPRAVIIEYQFGGVVRTIHLNRDRAPEGTAHTRQGYSVGRWQGDVLHIETTHLSPAFFALIGGREAETLGGPTSERARVIERWWPSRNEGAVMMDLVVDDPVYYEEPFQMLRREWVRVPTLSELDEWDCVSAGDILLNDNPDLDAFFE